MIPPRGRPPDAGVEVCFTSKVFRSRPECDFAPILPSQGHLFYREPVLETPANESVKPSVYILIPTVWPPPVQAHQCHR